ncbi:hypothetical protein CFC21_106715 [Triticum aestivum]|uniref:Uncharacterized protein n=2 Tax=Triticum aestivum TaxID=4565 RepID=A0A3B6THA3_WHEAT|nr:hypothetical protein CFC21_106715 [Triticum aestivum]
MATTWPVAGTGWGIGLSFLILTPIIAFYLPKILSRYSGDDINEARQKLQELEIHTIPELKKTLREVEEQRMLQAAIKETSDDALDKMVVWLRHAQYEAEDILDLIDYHKIERKFVLKSHGSSWPHRLHGTVSTCNMSCTGIAHIIWQGSAWLLQLARKSSLSRFSFLHRSDDVLPVTTSATPSPSDETVPAATSAAPRFCCSSIFYWFLDAGARIYRNWFSDVVGITGYKENATELDYVLPSVSRRNLKERIEKVQRTISLVKKSHLLVASKSAANDIVNMHRRKITSCSSKREVFGRDILLTDIMSKLLGETPHNSIALSSSSNKCYSVIGIYGVAGSGKTTLARYVLDHVKEYYAEHFDTLMCIHVTETFTVDDIFHDMLEQITKHRNSNTLSCEELKKKLKQNLRGKRFFLILDDVWVKGNNYQELKELCSPFNVGMKGSKILATARREDAIRALGANGLIAISDLDEDQYFRMFMHYALNGLSVDDREFEPIGRKIAVKLHRSPIAAAVVGGQLHGQTIAFWKTTATLDVLNDTMGALRWSYMQLDMDIRRCFEYCNIFPRRFKLEKDKLVHLWIAQGFVKTGRETTNMEDVAERYIHELQSCSFLQPEETGYFSIHDLVHELAQTIAGSDSFRIENASWRREEMEVDVPTDARHLFVQKYDGDLITKKILQMENLRTLIFYTVGRAPVEEKVIESIFKRLQKLRVLAITLSSEHHGRYIKKPDKISVSESISQLKHLRYLAIRAKVACRIILPSTLAKLYHIQMLDFGNCEKMELPTADLISMRRLLLPLTGVKFPNLGRSKLLQTLPGFTVRDEQGCELKQLRDLNKLRGSLWIRGLENVQTKKEALEANLAAKERLTQVSLEWRANRSCNPKVQADVLECLCPPTSLTKLNILNYKGSRYPKWMVCKQNGGPKDLKELRLTGWNQLGRAPDLVAFTLLSSLDLWNCGWDALPGNMEHLTLLKRLVMYKCLNILSLPTLPQSLERFLLRKCNDGFMKSCLTIGHPNWEKIEHIPEKTIADKTWTDL